MTCNQCKIEMVGRSDKKFCSVTCRKKYEYQNDILVRKAKIRNVYKNRRNKWSKLIDLTPEQVEKVKLIREC